MKPLLLIRRGCTQEREAYRDSERSSRRSPVYAYFEHPDIREQQQSERDGLRHSAPPRYSANASRGTCLLLVFYCVTQRAPNTSQMHDRGTSITVYCFFRASHTSRRSALIVILPGVTCFSLDFTGPRRTIELYVRDSKLKAATSSSNQVFSRALVLVTFSRPPMPSSTSHNVGPCTSCTWASAKATDEQYTLFV